MDYKVGDKVRIKSKDWLDAQVSYDYPQAMFKYCGATMTIEAVVGCFYELKNCPYLFKALELEFIFPKHAIHRRKFAPMGKAIY